MNKIKKTLLETTRLALMKGGVATNDNLKRATNAGIIANLYNIWIRWLVPKEPIEVNGYRMYLDPTDSLHLATNNIWEPIETEKMMMLVKGGVALDIGAHIGYYTLLFSQLGCEVHAFEPNEEMYGILNKNVALNNANATTYNVAIGEHASMGSLYVHRDCSGSSKTYDLKKDRGYVKEIRDCSIVPIDSFNIPNVNVVKIDVDGSELGVLKGMKETIERSPRVVMLIEIDPAFHEEKCQETVDLIKGYGFKIQGLSNPNFLCVKS